MSEHKVDVGKRRFLTGAVVAVGAAGTGFVATAFVKTWLPSARARARGAPVEVNITELEAGAQLVTEWRGKPIFIVRRTPKMLATLDDVVPLLRDPNSKQPQQPPYCQNKYRAISPPILVMIGICTHLGCVPDYRPFAERGFLAYPGYHCPCHGSKYDISGRVYKGVPAPLNMVIPPYHYEKGNNGKKNLVVIGVPPKDGGKEAA